MSDGDRMTDGWQESYEVMDGGGTDDEFWAMRSEVKGECGTVGFATFEGYDHPTSSGRVTIILSWFEVEVISMKTKKYLY